MKNKLVKITLIVIASILLLLLIVPFLIPVNSYKGLSSDKQAATSISKFITIPFEGTDGIDLHYIESTKSIDEETVYVLLHGSLFNAYTWNDVLDFFGEKGRAIAYDQIPYGLSEKLVSDDWTGPNPYSQDAAIEQLFAFLDILGLKKVILVGNSYGSVLAIKAALTEPERIEGLILGDAAVYVQEEMPSWFTGLPQVKHLGPLFARSLGSSDSFFSKTYLDPSIRSDKRKELTLINTKVTNWDIALWEYLAAWGSTSNDFVSRINEIDVPVLVVSGDSDNIVPLSDSRKLNSELKHSEIKIISNSGHVPQEETPDAFKNEIGPWLDINFSSK